MTTTAQFANASVVRLSGFSSAAAHVDGVIIRSLFTKSGRWPKCWWYQVKVGCQTCWKRENELTAA